MAKHKALGKGLSALIPDTDKLTEGEGTYFQCPIEAIEPNPSQPRMVFHDAELEDLARSIREKGILTPLLVRCLLSEVTETRLLAYKAPLKSGCT